MLTGELCPDGSVCLTEKEYRYLARVLRLKTGSVVDVRLTDGSLRPMRLGPGGKNAVLLPAVLSGTDAACGGVRASEALPAGYVPVWLFQWIIRGPKMDQVMRQAAETGAACIVPVAGQHCLYGDADAGRSARWERIVREARQQSGSAAETAVEKPLSPAEAAALWRSRAGKESAAFVLTEEPLAMNCLHGYLSTRPDIVALAVGPEGGMTGTEIALLSENGFRPLHLRTNVLRAETAALYGIAAVQTAVTEFDSWHGNG